MDGGGGGAGGPVWCEDRMVLNRNHAFGGRVANESLDLAGHLGTVSPILLTATDKA